MTLLVSSKNGTHCDNLCRDRNVGEYWEREFCKMAGNYGKSFTPMQIGRTTSTVAYLKINMQWNHYTLPDISVWSAPSEHHEIKHKNPTGYDCFGLEVYRFDALLWFAKESKQLVLYTIHNHDLAGGPEVKMNNINHWITANVFDLDRKWLAKAWGASWVNGLKKIVPIYYWHKNLWHPLTQHWNI